MKKLFLSFLFVSLICVGNIFGQTTTTQSTGGASNSLSTGFTGVLPVVNGGTGQTLATGTGAVVRATSPTIATATLTTPAISTPTITNAVMQTPTVTRYTMGAASYTIAAGITQVALTATIGATYTVTLPASNSLAAGTAIYFLDEIGTITTTNNIVIKAAGSDVINGLSSITLNGAYSYVCLTTDGSSKWTAISSISMSTGTWVPTWTGFSVDPSNVVARYILIGKWCTVTLYATAGTSNSTALTVTLPFAALGSQRLACNTLSNSIQVNGLVATSPGSNILNAYATVAAGAFATSNGKMVYLSGYTYEIE